jgi:hypothetical protein
VRDFAGVTPLQALNWAFRCQGCIVTSFAALLLSFPNRLELFNNKK